MLELSIKKVVAMLFGKNNTTTVTATTVSTAEKSFRFPETIELFNERIEEKNAENYLVKKEIDKLKKEVKQLQKDAGGLIENELRQRRARKVVREIENKENRTDEAAMSRFKKELAKELSCQEDNLIANQGEILNQNFYEDKGAYKSERRIVHFRQAYFLVNLKWTAIRNAIQHEKGGCYNKGWTEFIPTGNYLPPTVDWVTDSLSQMDEEELRIIQQHQEGKQ